MKHCPKCHTDNPDGAKFCGNCGAQLQKKVCPNCGTEIETNFCTQCGARAQIDGGGNSIADLFAAYCGLSACCTDIEGKNYKTVRIGNQEWMAENLAVTVDRNGNKLVLGEDYFYPDGDEKNVKEYGLLYTWEAAVRVAPEGWHLPSDDEFETLMDYCSDHYAAGGDTDNIAKALAATKGWDSSTNSYAVGNDPSSNNATGFSAVPAGDYSNSGYDYFGDNADFWSATERDSSDAYCRNLHYNLANVSRFYDGKSFGFSVRCVRN